MALEFDQVASGINARLTGAVTTKLRGFHEQFKGNDIYEYAIKEAGNIDWDTTDLTGIKTIARTITQKATGAGVEVGSKMIGEMIVAWGAALGLTTSAVTGGITAGLGIALSWGADALFDMVWPKGEEDYKVGDLIVINKAKASSASFRGFRRRLPADEILDVGIVTDKSQGYVTAINLKTQSAHSYAVQDVAKVPGDKVSAIQQQAPAIRKIMSMVSEMSEEGRVARPPHTVKAGDNLIYRDSEYQIRSSDDKYVVLQDEKKTLRVAIGDEDIVDGWNKSNRYHAGQLVWWKRKRFDREFELVCVQSVSTKEIRGVSAYDGVPHRLSRDMIRESDVNPSYFTHFIQAVVEDDVLKQEQNLPSRAYPHICFTDEVELEADRPIEEAEARPMIEGYDANTNWEAKFQDQAWDASGYQWDSWDARSDMSVDEPTSSGGGNMGLLVLAGAAVLAVMYSR